MKNYILLLQLCFVNSVSAQSYESQVKSLIDSFYQTHPKSVGIMIGIESGSKNISWNYAAGYSDKNSQSVIHPDQPVLTASNTKTYLAAAILKLAENKKLSIDQAINRLIKKKTNNLLKKAGYKTNKIKIKHLLSHTSGIADYVNDEYFKFVNEHKKYRWTRDEQIKLACTKGKPLAAPGDSFSYADINYLLVSEIIETITKKPFHTAIPELLEFNKNRINNTWFASLQEVPKGTYPLAHQYYDKFGWDSYDLDPSWDLYGGGGIATTTRDLSLFFQALFEGKIISDTGLLAKMYSPVYSNTNYCLGLRRLNINGHTAYYHGGWWGTDVVYFPEFKTAITIFILERSEKNISSEICKQVIKIIDTK